MNAKVSSLATFTLSKKQGSFEVKGLGEGNYRVIVSSKGYMEFKKTVSITATQKLIDFGNLSIEKDYKTLEGVVITSESPIVIKNDTVQFNASGFKTLPNATAEDLLKKIPGMDVDKEGNIKAQGEAVQKVLVDGKEFFGNDPKLATKNLTADMIESVQVFDDMSDQAKFTKIDDGSRSKTINIKLKKDRNKGYFGRALLGVGDNGRYEGNLSVNRFNGSKRISLLFNTNNINKQGFSFSDVISAMGGFSGFGGGGGRGAAAGAAVRSARRRGVLRRAPLAPVLRRHPLDGRERDNRWVLRRHVPAGRGGRRVIETGCLSVARWCAETADADEDGCAGQCRCGDRAVGPCGVGVGVDASGVRYQVWLLQHGTGSFLSGSDPISPSAAALAARQSQR